MKYLLVLILMTGCSDGYNGEYGDTEAVDSDTVDDDRIDTRDFDFYSELTEDIFYNCIGKVETDTDGYVNKYQPLHQDVEWWYADETTNSMGEYGCDRHYQIAMSCLIEECSYCPLSDEPLAEDCDCLYIVPAPINVYPSDCYDLYFDRPNQ